MTSDVHERTTEWRVCPIEAQESQHPCTRMQCRDAPYWRAVKRCDAFELEIKMKIY